MERVRNYAYLMRLDKPIGTLLLLWPTLCALLLASEASVDMKTIWLFCLGAFFARSMGCVINDFFDKNIDITSFPCTHPHILYTHFTP